MHCSSWRSRFPDARRLVGKDRVMTNVHEFDVRDDDRDAEEKPPALPLTFFDDLSENPAAKPWLVKNVIARGETSSWIAPPGKGKSALLFRAREQGRSRVRVRHRLPGARAPRPKSRGAPPPALVRRGNGRLLHRQGHERPRARLRPFRGGAGTASGRPSCSPEIKESNVVLC
jgi:hypothetical protein